MKLLSVFAAMLLILTSVTPAFSEESHTEARTDHYEVMELPDAPQALTWLAEKPLKMNVAMDEKQFETIHEESYYLEAAVDSLRKEAKDERQIQAIDALDESVQTVHYASEERKEEELKVALPLLLVHARQVRTLF